MKDEKAIIIQAEGKTVTAQVAKKSKVTLATKAEINDAIQMGASEIMGMLSGELADPTKKRCSRCVKMGRVPYHSLEDFSLLKNGKRHSQCKICRTEQAAIWCEKKKVHRKVYQAEYHKKRPKRQIIPKEVKAIMDAYALEDEPTSTKLDATEALFVAFTDSDIQETA